ncbi:hypothetical protein GCM10007160_43840 [Litchfieldella qijiaojingensis]|uniref:UvrD-like helicase C-terminal domain-containing protein n=1 Tax=Litchfieldella qijiaojingensis TaxID=980347 RepID=A0ABQ2ZCX7_9GAMM|nr:hypothetical protein GCM10007160_43840 [Halomonas qijiaojingensis]
MRTGCVVVNAMTVHKSQGSEFIHTALLLPDAPNPILTRELVYTGITRARHWFTLMESGRGILQEAVQRRVIRANGLGRLKKERMTEGMHTKVNANLRISSGSC